MVIWRGILEQLLLDRVPWGITSYYMVIYPVMLYRTRWVVLSYWRYHSVAPHAAVSSPIMPYRNRCGTIYRNSNTDTSYHMLLYRTR